LIAVAADPVDRSFGRADVEADATTGALRWEERDARDDVDRPGTERGDAAERYWAALDRTGDEGGADTVDLEDAEYTATLQRMLSRKHQQTLYIIRDLYPVLEPRIRDELYPRTGISLAERARILKDFVHIGVIDDVGAPRLHRLIAPVLDEIVSEGAAAELREIEREFLREKLTRREIMMSPTVWDLLRDTVSGLERNWLHHEVLQQIAAGGSFENYDRYTPSGELSSPMMQLSDAAGRLKLYLRDSRGPQECAEL
jgi:hypothetical protein